MYKLYTDGATSKNGQANAIGGWAFILLENDKILCSRAGKVQATTNNKCELLALINGCKEVILQLDPLDCVEVYSDSAYCINCINESWYIKWQKNGWINSSKQLVANKELWEQLIPFFDDPRFKWIKVRGHMGDKWNELVDKMAVGARSK